MVPASVRLTAPVSSAPPALRPHELGAAFPVEKRATDSVTYLPPPPRAPSDVVCAPESEPPPSSGADTEGRGPSAVRPERLADILDALRGKRGGDDPT